jgi:hypothetical protein
MRLWAAIVIGAALSDSVMVQRLKPTHESLRRPLQGNHVARNLACCMGVPSWLSRAAESARNSDNVECSCPDPAMAEKTIQQDEPKLTGDAVPLPRVAAAELSTQDFFWRFAYRGLPLIVTGANVSEWWARLIPKAVQCVEAEWEAGRAGYHERLKSHAEFSGCDQNNEWCPQASYVAKRDECVAGANILLEHAPRLLHEIPSDLVCHEGFDYGVDPGKAPFVLVTVEGFEFGYPAHFDAGCTGTISYQLQGSKFWRLWSPWDTTADNSSSTSARGYMAHTRFEGVVHPGDAVIYPPGYFHHTDVQYRAAADALADQTQIWEDAPVFGRLSIASAFYFPTVPWYGSLRTARGSPGEYSPFGYDTCAKGSPAFETSGWFARSHAWEEWFAGQPPSQPPQQPLPVEPTRQAEQRAAGRVPEAPSEPDGKFARARVHAVRKASQDPQERRMALLSVLGLVLVCCICSASWSLRARDRRSHALDEHGKNT